MVCSSLHHTSLFPLLSISVSALCGATNGFTFGLRANFSFTPTTSAGSVRHLVLHDCTTSIPFHRFPRTNSFFFVGRRLLDSIVPQFSSYFLNFPTLPLATTGPEFLRQTTSPEPAIPLVRPKWCVASVLECYKSFCRLHVKFCFRWAASSLDKASHGRFMIGQKEELETTTCTHMRICNGIQQWRLMLGRSW